VTIKSQVPLDHDGSAALHASERYFALEMSSFLADVSADRAYRDPRFVAGAKSALSPIQTTRDTLDADVREQSSRAVVSLERSRH